MIMRKNARGGHQSFYKVLLLPTLTLRSCFLKSKAHCSPGIRRGKVSGTVAARHTLEDLAQSLCQVPSLTCG